MQNVVSVQKAILSHVQRRKKTVKSNSLVFKWNKYYEVIEDYWDH